MRKRMDYLVVGAGPAGLSAGLELAERGCAVGIIDKADFPREKVCGGFIGPENKVFLERYGVLDELMRRGAQRVTHVLLSAPNGESVQVPLSFHRDGYGLGFSRKIFDELLLERAKLRGVEFEDMTVIRDVKDQGDRYQVRLAHMRDGAVTEIEVRHLIRASGAQRGACRGSQRIFGVSTLFDRCEGMESNVIMHFIPHGHAGINRFEGDAVNMCYVIKEDLFNRFGGDHAAIWDFFLRSNPWMERQMGGSRRLTPWKTTFVDMDRAWDLYDGTYFSVGDAAGVIDPVAGGGISMALKSGVMLGEILGQKMLSRADCARLAGKYRWLWTKRFGLACAVSRWAGAVGHQERWANAAIKLLKSNQALITGMFDLFHSPMNLKESL